MAGLAPRFSQLADSILTVSTMAKSRNMGDNIDRIGKSGERKVKKRESKFIDKELNACAEY